MHDLGAFQQAFSRALLDGGDSFVDAPSPSLQVALTIHRNTSFKGLVDALTANYPTVAQLVGEEWFRACAIEYVRAHPARSPVLATYGLELASFLTRFQPAAELPYLPDVARIDRLWVEAHTAQDAIPLSAADLARVPEEQRMMQSLTLHPATRFVWVEHSAATIWMHHRSVSSDGGLHVDDIEEGLLLTRPVGKVEHLPLTRSAFQFLELLSRGTPLLRAAEAVLATDATADIAGTLAALLTAGTFAHSPETSS